MENFRKNDSSESINESQNEYFESNKWNITVEDLSMKDLNSITDKEDIVFYRSSSSCSCTC